MNASDISPVVRTLINQVRALRPDLTGVPVIVKGDREIRIHRKQSGTVRNVDIAYDKQRDLYDVTVHEFASGSVESSLDPDTRVYRGVYAEQLGEALDWPATGQD